MNSITSLDVIKEILKFILLVFLWVILAALLVLLLPFLFVAFLVRTTEASIYRHRYNAVCLPCQDVLYTLTKPENRMTIAGFLQLDGKMDTTRLSSLIQQNLIDLVDGNDNKLYPKTTKHIRSGFINYYWVDDACFKLENHVCAYPGNPIESENELKAVIGNYCSEPLQDEFEQSPWQFVLIPYISEIGIRKTVIFFKMAHVIADGSALAYFLLNFLADSSNVNSTGIMVKKFSEIDRALLTLKGLWQLPLAYLSLGLMATDQNMLHSSDLSGQKHVTWSKPLDLNGIKSIKNSLHTTVNDVLVGTFGKSLHDYFKAHQINNKNDNTNDGGENNEKNEHNGEKIEKNKHGSDNNEKNEHNGEKSGKNKHSQNFSVVLAVDTRSSISEAEGFENHVAGAVISLSTEPYDIVASIKDTKKTLDHMKQSGLPLSIHLGWKYMSYLLPAYLAKVFVCVMADKTTGIISNVIGPQYEISIDGHPVEFLTFWPPQTNNETVGVSFCSYDGNVRVGLQIDSAVIQDPHEVLSIYEENLYQLIDTVNTVEIANDNYGHTVDH